METFIGMHSSRRKTERSQTLGYFVKIKQWCFCLLSIPLLNTGLTIRTGKDPKSTEVIALVHKLLYMAASCMNGK